MDRARPMMIVARALPAVFGGYVLANLASISLASILPLDRGDAVFGAILLSFWFYCIAIIWTFAARNTVRAWVGVLGSSAAFGILSFLLSPVGA